MLCLPLPIIPSRATRQPLYIHTKCFLLSHLTPSYTCSPSPWFQGTPNVPAPLIQTQSLGHAEKASRDNKVPASFRRAPRRRRHHAPLGAHIGHHVRRHRRRFPPKEHVPVRHAP